MGAPSYSPPPLDPSALAADQAAQHEQLAALQDRARQDSASVMARYGTMALAGLSKMAPVTLKGA